MAYSDDAADERPSQTLETTIMTRYERDTRDLTTDELNSVAKAAPEGMVKGFESAGGFVYHDIRDFFCSNNNVVQVTLIRLART
jgi:hypothetical protein